MALSPTERLILESWSGTVHDADVDDLDAAISYYGSAYGAALQRLMVRRADLANDENVSADGVSYDNSQNWERVHAQIADLVQYLSTADGITLSVREDALIASATQGGGTRVVDTVKDNSRRG